MTSVKLSDDAAICDDILGVAGIDGADVEDARRVEAVDEEEEVVESCTYSTTSQVWRVASGAKDTRRLATLSSASRSELM